MCHVAHIRVYSMKKEKKPRSRKKEHREFFTPESFWYNKVFRDLDNRCQMSAAPSPQSYFWPSLSWDAAVLYAMPYRWQISTRGGSDTHACMHTNTHTHRCIHLLSASAVHTYGIPVSTQAFTGYRQKRIYTVLHFYRIYTVWSHT